MSGTGIRPLQGPLFLGRRHLQREIDSGVETWASGSRWTGRLDPSQPARADVEYSIGARCLSMLIRILSKSSCISELIKDYVVHGRWDDLFRLRDRKNQFVRFGSRSQFVLQPVGVFVVTIDIFTQLLAALRWAPFVYIATLSGGLWVSGSHNSQCCIVVCSHAICAEGEQVVRGIILIVG